MLRRTLARNDRELLSLSQQSGLVETQADGSNRPNHAVSEPRTQAFRFLVEDEELPLEWGSRNQPWPRERAERVFQRGIKRTLALEHYEAFGFYGPCPVEIYSTSPWHALVARQYLRAAYPAFLPFQALQTLRIYHEPFAKFSEHYPRAHEEKIVLLDLRELRALIVGTFSAEDLLHAIRTLAGFQLPRQGILPLSGLACAEPDGSRTCVTFGHAGLARGPLRIAVSQNEALWTTEGLAAPGRQTFPAHRPGRNPSSVIFLCRDLHGALPAAARLNPEQARVFFESGYGGNGRGFDPCYTGEILARPRAQYGRLFESRLAQSGAEAWVVNAGRLGGEDVPAEVADACVAEIQAGRAAGPVAAPGAGPLDLAAPASLGGLSPKWLQTPKPEARHILAQAFRSAMILPGR